LVRVLINVVDAAGVKARTAANDAVDRVAFGEKEFAEIGAVLASNSGDKSRERGHGFLG
jgi:hypothetical protein